MLIYMFSFTVLVLLVVISIFYLIWISKKQKLEKEAYELHQVIQTHCLKLQSILSEVKPLMTNDKTFYDELQEYIKSTYIEHPVVLEASALDAKEFYGFLLHLEQDASEHVKIFTRPITLELDQMKLSLMRAREAYLYADNEYKFLTSNFPTNIMDKFIKKDKKNKLSFG